MSRFYGMKLEINAVRVNLQILNEWVNEVALDRGSDTSHIQYEIHPLDLAVDNEYAADKVRIESKLETVCAIGYRQCFCWGHGGDGAQYPSTVG